MKLVESVVVNKQAKQRVRSHLDKLMQRVELDKPQLQMQKVKAIMGSETIKISQIAD